MASIADQSVSELGGRWSILERQRRDHVRLDRLLDQLVSAQGPQQRAVLRAINRLVFPHAFAEESVLWPALRRILPEAEGEALTTKVEREHQEVNQLVAQLESGDPGDLAHPERRRILDRLVATLREDVRDEEDELLPRLQKRVGVGRLRVLGVAWEIVRRTAPTRPHPAVARRPPGNVLAALPLTAIDRVRDVLDAGAQQAVGPQSARLRRASEVLAGVAARVERVRVLRVGEHTSTRAGEPR